MSDEQQFIAELNPLLVASERAIVAGDRAEARRLAVAVVKLVTKYGHRLTNAEIREALNNPVAAEIATRLGVKPR